MAQSIKKRVNATGVGRMSERELKKLFDSALTDLAAIRTQVNLVSADLNNLQVVTNNLISAVNNIDVNCSNAVVNLNAATLAGVTALGALTLTA